MPAYSGKTGLPQVGGRKLVHKHVDELRRDTHATAPAFRTDLSRT
jgi:hypothetical protein